MVSESRAILNVIAQISNGTRRRQMTVVIKVMDAAIN